MQTSFTPGSLVRARGRDWIVLPGREPGLLRLRPLTRGHANEVGIYLPLEGKQIASAQFESPAAERPGDATGVMALFDAARLNLRSGAAPFRSIGRISVVPRPYQFVPLIMALRLDPVRLLIADDVGVGKTIEAGMIARELLDRGIAKRMAVLAPAHLCDQWERELREKFAIECALVQPSQIARLERDKSRQDVSIYGYYPHLVASIDFVKSDRGAHRDAFLRDAPDLVIVDEAHIAARPAGACSQSEQQRHELLRELVKDLSRHIILVTATPHSGIEESFRSLLGLLDPKLETSSDRKNLLPHVIQRRRRDVERWLGNDTPFPERLSEEERYDLGTEYLKLFNDVLDYCRETVAAGTHLKAAQQRVRHWAAIAILRCLLSSPDAAAAVLNSRVDRMAEGAADGNDQEMVDRAYRPQVLDALGDEETGDHAPIAPLEDPAAEWSNAERRRLLRYRDRARELGGPNADRKLRKLIDVLRGLLNEGRKPIVFCRFIQTANYLATWLSEEYKVDVRAVTGEIDDQQRKERIAELAGSEQRVLVATDCLSEGVNLQDHFDAVIHYDLPWNPNRLEQREGRVDRFGQPKEDVKSVLIYGANNPVDQVVLDVLIRKARKIRRDLGIAVPVPVQAEQVIQTVVDNVLLRRREQAVQLELALSTPDASRLHEAWDAAAEREKRQRGYFTQHGIQPDEVAQEIEATDAVLGDTDAVHRFLADSLQRFGGSLEPAKNSDGVFQLSPGNLKTRLQDFAGREAFPLAITFDRRKNADALYLGRTQPLVTRVCDAVLGEAFAPECDDRFARAGAMFTDTVTRWTALVLLRFRYRLIEYTEEFAEEIVLAAFERGEDRPRWLQPYATAGRNLADAAVPKANISREERSGHVERALAMMPRDSDWFRPILDWRVAELEAAHKRLRTLLKERPLKIHPHTPPDILGCFVLVPVKGNG
jgi:superfamily II DNA or RNA helicase